MRLFEIYNDKNAQLFSGTPSAAAKKAMTALCGRRRNVVCTKTIVMREVKRVMVNGEYRVVPVLDADNMEIKRKYKLKRVPNETEIVFEGNTPVTFRYKTEIVESFGRVA